MLPKRTCNYCGTEIFLNDNYVIFSDKDNNTIICEKCYNEHKNDGSINNEYNRNKNSK